MQIEMNGPATSGKANGAKIETASFLGEEYNEQEFAATLNRQIALIRSRFGTTDHLAANVAALAFAGGAA